MGQPNTSLITTGSTLGARGPRWNDLVDARIRNRLSQVLVHVRQDVEDPVLHRAFPAEYLDGLTGECDM